ncbi:MAG: family N-acetyltransferase [Firmicutes bacterium]|nr:family N-acetyltransferase [Bacillota bacterium]
MTYTDTTCSLILSVRNLNFGAAFRGKFMIRKMKKEDLLSAKILMQSIPNFWHESWTEDTIEKALTASAGLSFVYELNSQIVGVIFAFDFGFRAYIAELAVSEQSRNLGIARNLIEHVEFILKKKKCELVIADVWKTAEPFYKKLGWEHPNAILVRKSLID